MITCTVSNPKIEAWLDGLEVQDNHAYILEHRNQKGESIQVRYLIYLPGMTEMANISIGQHTCVFGNDLTLDIEDAPGSGELVITEEK